MDTNKLLHFKTISQTGNLREAATLLNISHAGLSKSIKTLERELGIELITKDGRGIKVTNQGLKLIKEADTILNAVDKLKIVASGIEIENRMNCRIGTFEVFSTYLSPFLTESLPNEANISFNELLPGRIEEELIKGNIDYGISYLPIPHRELDHLKVTSINMGVFAHMKFQNIPLSDLPFVIPASNIDNTPTKAKGLDGWPDDTFPRKVKYTVALMETALALTRSGNAVGYFPRFIAEKHNEIINKKYQLHELVIPTKIKIKQDVFLIKRKDSMEDITSKKIAKVLRSLT